MVEKFKLNMMVPKRSRRSSNIPERITMPIPVYAPKAITQVPINIEAEE